MRAIIIEEERFTEILDTLKYESERMAHRPEMVERLEITPQVWAAAVGEAHRNFHFYLVRWMQSHGVSGTKR